MWGSILNEVEQSCNCKGDDFGFRKRSLLSKGDKAETHIKQGLRAALVRLCCAYERLSQMCFHNCSL